MTFKQSHTPFVLNCVDFQHVTNHKMFISYLNERLCYTGDRIVGLEVSSTRRGIVKTAACFGD